VTAQQMKLIVGRLY